MELSDLEATIKIIVVGDGCVGKTSFIENFVTNNYKDEYKKTIGTTFFEKSQYIKSLNRTVRFALWDTAGQDEFDTITKKYYEGAGAALLIFSTTDRKSFENIWKWKEKVRVECGNICMALIQNKVDLIDEAVVSNEEVESLAKRLYLKLFRVSAKLFEHIAESYFTIIGNSTEEDQIRSILDVEETEEERKEREREQYNILRNSSPRDPSIIFGKKNSLSSPIKSSNNETINENSSTELTPSKLRTKGKKDMMSKAKSKCQHVM